uniref:Uncharacterized protein n=1 Tax=Arundo donax TaxID=35708 RepID=A0A0A9FND2_ARUDO
MNVLCIKLQGMNTSILWNVPRNGSAWKPHP